MPSERARQRRRKRDCLADENRDHRHAQWSSPPHTEPENGDHQRTDQGPQAQRDQ